MTGKVLLRHQNFNMTLTLPQEVAEILEAFAVLFAQTRSWQHAQVLLVGLLLCHGKRTISRILQVMGLSDEQHYANYYRILNRVRWSARTGAKLLLKLLVERLLGDAPLVIGLDDTLERRWGKQIAGLGRYRDPVRSTSNKVVSCSGLKWVVMQILMPVPWSQRVWGLPFSSVLAPSKRDNETAGRRHKTLLDWSRGMVSQVSRWVSGVLYVADGSFGNPKFAWVCRERGAHLISRLRLDAGLYDFAPVRDPHRRGKHPSKGARRANLKQLLEQRHLPHPLPLPPSLRDGSTLPPPIVASLRWYGGQSVVRHLYSDTALWYVDSTRPLPIRWVLVVDPSGTQPPMALFSTQMMFSPQFIVETFVTRWALEVTFEETRAHLGLQTQRHWSQPAVQRATPVVFAAFSITCLLAHALSARRPLKPRSTAWYVKREPTFSDLLETVRTCLWQAHPNFARSTLSHDPALYFTHDDPWWMGLLASSLSMDKVESQKHRVSVADRFKPWCTGRLLLAGSRSPLRFRICWRRDREWILCGRGRYRSGGIDFRL